MKGDYVVSARRDKVLIIEAGLPIPGVRTRVQRCWIRAYDRASVHLCVQDLGFGIHRRDSRVGSDRVARSKAADSNDTAYC